MIPDTTHEQDEILAKDIQSLTVEELFHPVPLLARLESKGHEYMAELVH